MNPVILYRKANSPSEDQAEIEAAKNAGFVVISSRAKIEPLDFVVPRYSSLPFYKELEEDCIHLGAKLINSSQHHAYIADLQNWVYDLVELTPLTWDNLQDLPDDCSFILKGETNSKKGHWKTHCFAENKQEAINVYNKLYDDGLIGQQKIYIRKYIPLHNYGYDVQGMPITKEFRFFIYNKKVISSGFYWGIHQDIVNPLPDPNEVPQDFLDKVIARVGHRAPFLVVDVAQDQEGNWLVIELNCGTMSGLSLNNPNTLYTNLFKAIKQVSYP